MRARLLALALLAAAPATPATITIVNMNSPGQGFNDPTPASPVGGNAGTTVGAQRLNCFKEAARIWGGLLPSGVEITVQAIFVPLECTETTGVLGAAGSINPQSDFPGAPLPSTWYVQAVANSITGRDTDPATADIEAYFNSELGKPGCLSGSGFYLGLDGDHGPRYDLVTVLLHELGHGLGFASMVDTSTGRPRGGQLDAYARQLVDDTTGRTWSEMSSSERLASMVSGALAWGGPAATAYAPSYVRGKAVLVVTAPASVEGAYLAGDATFGPSLTDKSVLGSVVQARDESNASGPQETDACTAITNAGEVNGRIALVDRGQCTFVVKARNVQSAGAIGMIVADHTASSTPLGMSGTDPSITIPSVRITLADAGKLRAALPLTASLEVDSSRPAGVGPSGRLLMYSPTVLERGSSVSHFDTSASPNALMEPSINEDLRHNVDATLALLKDVGWFTTSQPTWILPSAARVSGAGGAFYTTDVTIGNGESRDVEATLRFLGNNQDGSGGPEKTVTVPKGGFRTFTDVIGSAFGIDSGFGAIRVSADSSRLSITSQTSTPGPAGGTFGQSVPAVGHDELGVQGGSRVIAGAREDAAFRTNLVLVNATPRPLDLTVDVLGESGEVLGTQALPTFQPHEMRQLGRVLSAVTAGSETVNATLKVTSTTPGGAFATYAAVIDNATNDPRTLLPAPDVTGAPSWLLPSSARASGAGGAFYTTDLTVTNHGILPSSVALRFLGNNRDGRTGPQVSFSLEPGRSRRLEDVLGETFSLSQDYGAIRLTGSSSDLAIVSQTSTPGGTGTFGQSVPAFPSTAAVTPGYPRRILAAREDSAFRTNLVVANASQATADVDVVAYDAAGAELGRTKIEALRPYEMRQIGRILSVVTGRSDIAAASLVVSTSTPGALVTTYAAVIDNVTNDPRTLLAQ